MLSLFSCCLGARRRDRLQEARLPLRLPSETTPLLQTPAQSPPLSPPPSTSPHPRDLTPEERRNLERISERIASNMQSIFPPESSHSRGRGRGRDRGVQIFSPASGASSRATSRASSPSMEALEREARGYGELVQVTRVSLGLRRGRSRGVKQRSTLQAPPP